MKIGWTVLLMAMVVCAGRGRAEEAKAAPETGGQGIAGKIEKMVGNFMPGPDRTGGSREAMSVPVHVFRGDVAIFKEPDPKHPKLVKIVQSGKDGSYRCALPPGTYTVVPVIDGELRYNVMKAKRVGGKVVAVWPTVAVKKDQWTKLKISDTSEATF